MPDGGVIVLNASIVDVKGSRLSAFTLLQSCRALVCPHVGDGPQGPAHSSQRCQPGSDRYTPFE